MSAKLVLLKQISLLRVDQKSGRVYKETLPVGTELIPHSVDLHPKNEQQRRTPIIAIYDGIVLRLGRGVTRYVPSKKVQEALDDLD